MPLTQGRNQNVALEREGKEKQSHSIGLCYKALASDRPIFAGNLRSLAPHERTVDVSAQARSVFLDEKIPTLI